MISQLSKERLALLGPTHLLVALHQTAEGDLGVRVRDTQLPADPFEDLPVEVLGLFVLALDII